MIGVLRHCCRVTHVARGFRTQLVGSCCTTLLSATMIQNFGHQSSAERGFAIKIPKPTWSIKSLALEEECDEFLISDEEINLLSKRCLILVDENDDKLKGDVNRMIKLMSKVKGYAETIDATPEEMYDCNGASYARLRSSDTVNKDESSDFIDSVRHKMTELDGNPYFVTKTKKAEKPRSK